MDSVIDRLVNELRDQEVDVRRKALEELSEHEDKLHAIPAIHWTMLNDVDDEIRRYAREVYMKIGAKEKDLAQSALEQDPADARSRKEEHRVHIKPTLGWPNPLGNWSVHCSLIAIGLITLAYFIELPFAGEKPLFIEIMRYVGTGFTIPGIILGILGIVRAGERKKSTPVWGLVLNGVILLVRIQEIITLIRS